MKEDGLNSPIVINYNVWIFRSDVLNKK